ncbi:hypothetical protein MYX84_00680 [Acidobacteria bacterium AH-259-O06]|nr:hypothetical protein [Acidobacteria bacterium AH-259-O06]
MIATRAAVIRGCDAIATFPLDRFDLKYLYDHYYAFGAIANLLQRMEKDQGVGKFTGQGELLNITNESLHEFLDEIEKRQGGAV